MALAGGAAAVALTDGLVADIDPTILNAPAVSRESGAVWPVVYTGAPVVTAPCMRGPNCPDVVDAWATPTENGVLSEAIVTL